MDAVELHRALGHHARPEILRAAALGPISAKRFSDATGGDLRSIAYHFRLLRDCGLLVAVESQRRRGSTETFYRAAPAAGDGIAELAGVLEQLAHDLGASATQRATGPGQNSGTARS